MTRPDTRPRAGLEDAAEAHALVTRAMSRLARGERGAGLEIADALLVMTHTAKAAGLAVAEQGLAAVRDIALLLAEGADANARDLALLTSTIAASAGAIATGVDPSLQGARLADLTHLRDDIARRALLGAADLWRIESQSAPNGQLAAAVQDLARLIDGWSARTGRDLRLVLDVRQCWRDGDAVALAVASLGKLVDVICQRTGEPRLTFHLTARSHVLGSTVELIHDGAPTSFTAPRLADELLDALASDIGAPALAARPREPSLAVIEVEIGRLGGALSIGGDKTQTVIRAVLPRSLDEAFVELGREAA